MAQMSDNELLFSGTASDSATTNSGVWQAPFPGRTRVTFIVQTDQALTGNVQSSLDGGTTWQDLQGATSIAIAAGEPHDTIEVAHAAGLLRLEMVNASGSDATVIVRGCAA